MIVISNVHYPPASTREVAKRYLKAKALPDYITKKGPYISSSTQMGIHSITYYEMENHRLPEGLVVIGESMSEYFGVPGYTYDIKPYFELEEGLGILGL